MILLDEYAKCLSFKKNYEILTKDLSPDFYKLALFLIELESLKSCFLIHKLNNPTKKGTSIVFKSTKDIEVLRKRSDDILKEFEELKERMSRHA